MQVGHNDPTFVTARPCVMSSDLAHRGMISMHHIHLALTLNTLHTHIERGLAGLQRR